MPSFTERYHELTKYNPRSIDKLGPVQWDSQPPPFKEVHAENRIDLLPSLRRLLDEIPQPPERTNSDADQDPSTGASGPTLGSTDHPAENIATLDGLTRLLFFTLGLTARMSQGGEHDIFLRAAPSAGGLYPTELYVAVRDVEGLADGLYHYHSLRSSLYPVWQGNFWADLRHYFLGHPAIESSKVIVLMTGMYARSAWRYKERAYRRILLDTGHALGNLIEVCREMHWDFRLMGGFLDAGLEELFFLGSGEEFPLLGIALGAAGSLPAEIGQLPGPIPAQAVLDLPTDAAMQVQQNHCERLRSPAELRTPLRAESKGPGYIAKAAEAESILPLILKRRSCRKFTGAGIPVDEMRDLLGFALRSEAPTGNDAQTGRDGAPTGREASGEWRLAPGMIDMHLVILDVPGLDAGVYALNAETLRWRLTRAGDFRQDAYQICLGQELAAECAFLLIYTADMAALAARYGDRGYRYGCLDCGQIGERINLQALHLGLGSSGIGGYYDDLANELLDLPLSHGVLYITVTGVPEERD